MDRMPDEQARMATDEGIRSASEGEMDERRREMLDMVQKMGLAFARERKSYIDDRAACGVENRWREDLYYYHGKDEANRQPGSEMMDNIGATGRNVVGRSEDKPARSRLFVNVTRPKTNAAEARLADMLFPLDERNWGIKPTPVPELTKAMQDKVTPVLNPQGQQMQVQGGRGRVRTLDVDVQSAVRTH